MNIFETHAHLDFDDYKKIESGNSKCIQSWCQNIINIGIDERAPKLN